MTKNEILDELKFLVLTNQKFDFSHYPLILKIEKIYPNKEETRSLHYISLITLHGALWFRGLYIESPQKLLKYLEN